MSNPFRRVLASLRLVAGIPTDDFAGMTLPEYLIKQAREHTVAPDPKNLQGFMATPGGMATEMLVMIFAEALAKTSAPNYLTIEGEAESTGPIEITIRRVQGKSPTQALNEMASQISRLRDRLQDCVDRLEIFIESEMTDEADQEAYDAARFLLAELAKEASHG